jgi:hypothetical protein
VASDTSWAPWFVVRSDEKRSARLNVIRHLLDQLHYEALPREKVILPKRQPPGGYKGPEHPLTFVAEHEWTEQKR